jgi:hypothetical protein
LTKYLPFSLANRNSIHTFAAKLIAANMSKGLVFLAGNQNNQRQNQSNQVRIATPLGQQVRR